MFNFRRNLRRWLMVAGFGCLSIRANAFVGVRPPVAEVLPSSALRPQSFSASRITAPLRAIPVDTEAIRLLSGAAGNGAGINTNVIYGGLGSLAWKILGAFIAVNFIFALFLVYLMNTVFEDISNDFVERMRDKDPAKLEDLQEKARTLMENDFFEEEAAERTNDPQSILLASILDDSDLTNEVLLSSIEKAIDEFFGDGEAQDDSQKN